MNRILITGCDSCTGEHLAAWLASQGERKLIGADLGATCRRPLPLTDYHRCDIRDAASVAALLAAARPTHVYHLAASADERDPAGLLRTNVEGTLHLLTACLALTPPPRVLVVGSCAVYPDLAPDQAGVAETTPPAPLSLYGASRVAQAAVAGVHARRGLPVVLTRTFNLVGPGLGPHLAPTALALRLRAARARGERELPLHDGDAVRDFVDVRDAVRAYHALLERGTAGEVYNVGSGTGTTIRAMAELLAAVSGGGVAIVPAPADDTPVRSPLRRSIADVTRLRAATGWAPAIPLRQSLAEVYAALPPDSPTP